MCSCKSLQVMMHLFFMTIKILLNWQNFHFKSRFISSKLLKQRSIMTYGPDLYAISTVKWYNTTVHHLSHLYKYVHKVVSIFFIKNYGLMLYLGLMLWYLGLRIIYLPVQISSNYIHSLFYNLALTVSITVIIAFT